MKSIHEQNIVRYGIPVVAQEECWESDFEVHDSCPYHIEQTLIITQADYSKILALDREFDTEFSIYFDVIVVDAVNKKFKMTNIRIPKQIVTTASVDFVDHVDCAGVLHKHPRGVTSFSHTDDKYINLNHDFSVLLEAGEIRTAVGRIKTPCNHVLKTNVKIELEPSNPEEHSELIALARTMITQPSYVNMVHNQKGMHSRGAITAYGYTHGIGCTNCGDEIFKSKKYRECELCGNPLCVTCANDTDFTCNVCRRKEYNAQINHITEIDDDDDWNLNGVYRGRDLVSTYHG